MASRIQVVQTAAFLKDIEGVLDDHSHKDLVEWLATNPLSGDVIPQTGGVRKLRWAASGRGKRGGGRAIYYYHNESMPLYVFKFYVKAARSDLTPAEKKSLRGVIKAIVDEHKRKN